MNRDGLATTAYFRYGIPPSAQGPEGSGPTFTQFTPVQTLGPDFSSHSVSASASGLVPNELYDVQLVATNSAGTTNGPVETFTTAANAAPPPPVLGEQVNVSVVSGSIWIKPPPGKSLGAAGDGAQDPDLSKGQGFVPLTEARQIPTGSEIDALHGSLRVVSNTGEIGKSQTATLAGGVFNLTQTRTGITKGLTNFNLVENAFQGAPTYAACNAKYTAGDATAASLSTRRCSCLRSATRQVAHQRPAQRSEPFLVVRERRPPAPARLPRQPRAHRVSPTPSRSRRTDTHPSCTSPIAHLHSADQEVPLRMPIDKALKWGYVLLPLPAPHHTRDGLVFGRPSNTGQAVVALSRRRSRQPKDVL